MLIDMCVFLKFNFHGSKDLGDYDRVMFLIWYCKINLIL